MAEYNVLKKYNTNEETGLSHEEAEQRLAENGPNIFAETKPPSVLKLIWEQINSLLIY